AAGLLSQARVQFFPERFRRNLPDMDRGNDDAALALEPPGQLVDERRVAGMSIEQDDTGKAMVEKSGYAVFQQHEERLGPQLHAARDTAKDIGIAERNCRGRNRIGSARHLFGHLLRQHVITHRTLRPLKLLRAEGNQNGWISLLLLSEFHRGHVLQPDLLHCATGILPPCRGLKQLCKCPRCGSPGSAGCRTGSVVAQAGIENGQRGRKGHPSETKIDVPSSPASAGQSGFNLSSSSETVGMEARSCWVYRCLGEKKTFS